MTKQQPENIADLVRMMNTSYGWFDGRIESKMLCKPSEYDVGVDTDQSVRISAYDWKDALSVICERHFVSEKLDTGGYSIGTEELWRKEMTFDEFRSSEWWEPAMEKFEGGDCDASELFVRYENDPGEPERYGVLTAHIERRYRDWLGNNRLAKGTDSVDISIDRNGEMEFRFNKEHEMLQASEFMELVHEAKAFRDAGIKLEDGKLIVEVKE